MPIIDLDTGEYMDDAKLAEFEAKRLQQPKSLPTEQQPSASSEVGRIIDLDTGEYIDQQQKQPETPIDQEPLPTNMGGHMARSNMQINRNRELERQVMRYRAGDLSSYDVSPEQMEAIRAKRIADIPEITGSFKELSNNLGLKQALIGMTAFDPDEFGAILTKAEPKIGIVTTPEGERLAINRETNEAMSINKVGPSWLDAIQLGGAAAMFTPAGRLSGIGKQTAGAIATQSAIEGAQHQLGGEFNPADVAIAGAAVPVVALGGKYLGGKWQLMKDKMRLNNNLIDTATGLPVPAFERALKKRNIDFGALVDDIDSLPIIRSARTPEETVDEIIKHQLKTGKRSNTLYQFRLEDGNIVDDLVGKEAVRQGYKKGDVVAAKMADEPTRREMERMLLTQRAIHSNSSKAKDMRPSDIPGEALMGRFEYIKNDAAKKVAELNKIANSEFNIGKNLIEHESTKGGRLKGLQIDTTNIESRLLKELNDLRIFVPDGTPLQEFLTNKATHEFVGSQITKDKASQKVIKDVFDILREHGNADAFTAHNIKRQLDAMIDFRKQSKEGLTESGRRFAKAIRHELNESIRKVSPKYARVNDDLSKAITSMNNLQEALGGSIHVFDDGAEQAVGTKLRTLFSNYSTRKNLDNAVNEIDSVARDLGGKFNTDVKDLTNFASVLDDRFGAIGARNSFQGRIDSTLNVQSLRPSQIVKDKVAKEAMAKIESMQNINDTQAFNVMQKILRGQK